MSLKMLDGVDRLLLGALQDDCKRSLAELGELVDLSPGPVMERIRKLEEHGFITGYHASLDARKAGLDIGAFIGVGIDHPRNQSGFEKSIEEIPEVLESHHVTGRHSLMLKVRTHDTESLQKLISRLRELPGVERTETMVILQTQLEKHRIPLGLEETVSNPKAETRSEVKRRAPRGARA